MGCIQPTQKREVDQKEKTMPAQPKPEAPSILHNPYLPQNDTLKPVDHNNSEAEGKPKVKNQPLQRKSNLAKLFEQNRKKRLANKDTNLIRYISNSSQKSKQTATPTKQTAVKMSFEEHMLAVKKMMDEQGEDISACAICTEEYDLKQREPMMLCMNQHTFCNKCINDLYKKGYNKCPLDMQQFEIKDVKKNRIVCELLTKIKENHE